MEKMIWVREIFISTHRDAQNLNCRNFCIILKGSVVKIRTKTSLCLSARIHFKRVKNESAGNGGDHYRLAKMRPGGSFVSEACGSGFELHLQLWFISGSGIIY